MSVYCFEHRTVNDIRVATSADNDKSDRVGDPVEPHQSCDQSLVVGGTGSDALVEEKHCELHAPEKRGVRVPGSELDLGAVLQPGDVCLCEASDHLLGDANILTGVVDDSDGSGIQREEAECSKRHKIIACKTFESDCPDTRSISEEQNDDTENVIGLYSSLSAIVKIMHGFPL